MSLFSKMVKNMRNKMSLFIVCLGRASSKKCRDAIFIGDMDIPRLIVYMQQVEEEKLREREEYRNKKVKIGKILVNISMFQNDPYFRNKSGIYHHLLVHLRPET